MTILTPMMTVLSVLSPLGLSAEAFPSLSESSISSSLLLTIFPSIFSHSPSAISWIVDVIGHLIIADEVLVDDPDGGWKKTTAALAEQEL